jgi:hypothetical protein
MGLLWFFISLEYLQNENVLSVFLVSLEVDCSVSFRNNRQFVLKTILDSPEYRWPWRN